jgi:hypothetical protein
MKRFRSALCFLLILLLSVSVLPVQALAATDTETYNNLTLDWARHLISTYDIDIAYGYGSNGYATIGPATLANLEIALQSITAPVVRQLSDFCRQKTGNRLKIVFRYLPSELRAAQMDVLGSYTLSTATMEFYIPATSADLASGNNPLVVTHEFGHLFHDYVGDKIGFDTLKKNWMSLNGSASYSATNPSANATTFASIYAACDYDEDIAETFAYAFCANRAGLGITSRLRNSAGNPTNLARKIAYTENLIAACFTNSANCVANLRKVYSTPTNLSFMNQYMSGDIMMYIGYHEPAGLANNVLAAAGLRGQPYTWRSDVGGWLVTATTGTWLVFPGSSQKMALPQRQAA